MGFIRMSTNFAPTINTFLLGNLRQANGTGILVNLLEFHAQSAGEIGGRFYIMKGTPPVNAAGLPTSFNSRSTDALILFDPTSFTSVTGTSAFAPSQIVGFNPATLTTIYINALASGTATWYWWFTTQLSSGNTFDNNQNPYNQIVGTVGVTGSGADLTLPSTTVTAGSPYRIFNYRLQIPREWTF